MSFDSVEDNRRFAEKFGFPFKLLSDPKREMGLAYGACDQRDAGYASRIAYVIEGGKVSHAYKVKDPAQHAAQVLADLGAEHLGR